MVPALLGTCTSLILFPTPAVAQGFPNKPLHIVVPFAPGGAVGSDKRVAIFPDVPTVGEAGLPGYEAAVWWGFVAPAKTPRDVIVKLNAELNKAMAEPAVRDKLTELGVVFTPGTPDRFGEFLKAEVDKWARVIKAAGIQAD